MKPLFTDHETSIYYYYYYYYYYYKDLFRHKDINTYINGVVKICLNKFFLQIQVSKRKEKKYAKLCTNRKH